MYLRRRQARAIILALYVLRIYNYLEYKMRTQETMASAICMLRTNVIDGMPSAKQRETTADPFAPHSIMIL